MKLPFSRTALLVGATVPLVALAAIGIGSASIPSASTGLIKTCYFSSGNTTGYLKPIDADAGQTCGQYEKPLNFNQIGPQGPQGIQGIQGIQGVKGDKGDKG